VTTLNNSSIAARTSEQLSNKGPIGYNGMPQIQPKTTPSPSTITTPSNTPIRQPTPLTKPNGIWIQSAVLPQYTLRTDQLTDQPTDGLGKCSVT